MQHLDLTEAKIEENDELTEVDKRNKCCDRQYVKERNRIHDLCDTGALLYQLSYTIKPTGS